ncbi:MAG: YqgE/AlgH family protein [Planktotalea sp.]|uniref:YqgE/AlgH family protein n=1 Tax=Planktotalea sp. TaxID=2029877 RepID=UPI003C764019
MTTTELLGELTGKCLISMPDMPDPRFQGSVIFLCTHSSDGAMGLIVNKRVQDVNLADLLEQLSIPNPESAKSHPIYYGGPVESSRGFVLHSPDYRSELSSMDAGEGLVMTATIDILEDIGAGNGPEKALVLLGYAGWGAGQLEAEIAANGWLIAQVENDVIFDAPDAKKWALALAEIGIDPAILSSSGGSA